MNLWSRPGHQPQQGENSFECPLAHAVLRRLIRIRVVFAGLEHLPVRRAAQQERIAALVQNNLQARRPARRPAYLLVIAQGKRRRRLIFYDITELRFRDLPPPQHAPAEAFLDVFLPLRVIEREDLHLRRIGKKRLRILAE